MQAAELRVCIMSADFWGVPASGGTATAYHLLADAIASNIQNRVCLAVLVAPSGLQTQKVAFAWCLPNLPLDTLSCNSL